MSRATWVMMTVVLLLNWGGFALALLAASRRQDRGTDEDDAGT